MAPGYLILFKNTKAFPEVTIGHFQLLAFYQEILKIYVLGDFDGYDAYFADDIED